ncbi:MAG TPA: chalcone isomerase family protein [Deltaproteobacteria bacterium]|nr:chalcone isomerase family protein [Deltaproteobacteria bacterium]HOI06637.1 chalcone isomerase family protein [Deltaproteobacteria bacterium]
MFKKISGIVLVSVMLATAGYSMEVAGVNMADTISAGGTTLTLNGAGLRTKFFIKAYIAGLYLAQKSNNAAAIVAADQPMAIRLYINSKMITSDKMEAATKEGFQNATKGNTAPIQAKIDSFMATFKEPLKVGDIFDFVNVPGKGVEIYKNGTLKNTVAGLDFKKALFGIWLGDKPAQDDLKAKMLGK